MRLAIVWAILFCVSLAAAAKWETQGVSVDVLKLDPDSGVAIVSAVVCQPDFSVRLVPRESMIFILRSVAERRLQSAWLIMNPQYSAKITGSSLNYFEGGCSKASGALVHKLEGVFTYRLEEGLSSADRGGGNWRWLRARPDTLRVAVLEDNRLFSQKGSGEDRFGADIIFAKKIGIRAGRPVKLIGFDSKGLCLAAILSGRADLAIASLPESDDGALKYSLPYFRTGAVFAAANPGTIGVFSQYGPRSRGLNLAVLKGTPAADSAAKMKPAGMHYFPTLFGLKNRFEEINIKAAGRYDGFVALLPEMEAMILPGFLVIEFSGQRFWTKESYSVAGKDARLIGLVNEVIDKGEVPVLYANLFGRPPKKE